LPKLALPPHPPKAPQARAYGGVKIELKLIGSFEWILSLSRMYEDQPKPVYMELLNEGPGYGQRYGFVLYRQLLFGRIVEKYEVTGRGRIVDSWKTSISLP